MAADVTRLISETKPRQDGVRSPPDYGSNASVTSSEETVTIGVSSEHRVVRVYQRRWFMLFVFCCYSFTNGYQWIHVNIVEDIMFHYYNASLPEGQYNREVAMDWLALVYLATYFPLIMPAFWVLDIKGVRFCCVVGSFINSAGAWIRVGALSPNRFPVLVVSQVVASLAQLWTLGLPTRLSAIWFPPHQTATATSIGVFGYQLGMAVGFLLPPYIVTEQHSIPTITWQLTISFYSLAAVTSVVFLAILIRFEDKPPHPPSKAQLLAAGAMKNVSYIQSIKGLVTNRGFLLLFLSYGLVTGSFYAISTLLNQIILSYFAGDRALAGTLGLTVIVTGVIGSLLAGFWLDYSGAFKGTTIIFFLFSFIGMGAFTFTLHFHIRWLIYLIVGVLGFFMTGYIPIGVQYGAEITYPISEATSSALLTGSATCLGLVLTLILRPVLDVTSAFYVNLIFACTILIAAILSAFHSVDYRQRRVLNTPIPILTNVDITSSLLSEEEDSSRDVLETQSMIQH